MTAFALPVGYGRVQPVRSFDELVTTPFADGVNALCWRRTLPGDFGEVVRLLDAPDDIASLDDQRLAGLPLSPAGRMAIEVLLDDQRLLRAHGLAPVLDCIRSYPRDEEDAVVPTDVYSFHADRATVETDTYLCTYYGPPSEGLCNEEAQRRVDDRQTLERLRRLFGEDDDDGFQEFLRENCYDLHYASLPEARIFSFGVGNLWRIAVEYPGCPVPPCIHRAPATIPGQLARLLLIS